MISVLGEVEATSNGVRVPVTSRRQRELLAILALSSGSPRTIDMIVDDLWGDDAPPTARKNVQVLVGRLRAVLGAKAIPHVAGQGYLLDPSEWTFVHLDFQKQLDHARRLAREQEWTRVSDLLEHALRLWTQDALGSLSSERWAVEHARVLDAEHQAAQTLLVEALVSTGRFERAIVELAQLTSGLPDELDVSTLRVRALYGAGRQADALDACRAALARARERRQEAEVDQLRVLERGLLGQVGDFSVHRGPALPRVPVPRDELVGRADEVALVHDRLSQGTRLVTIIGPGGAGKTRLATTVALRLAAESQDVAWIDLSPAASTDDVLAILLNVFGITSAGDDPVDALILAIGDRDIAIVLDNFEQVISSAANVAAIRDACARLRVLVTSRTALGVSREDVVSLAPFDLMDDAEGADADTIARLDAVRLFFDRAAIIDGIAPSGRDTVLDVHRICAKVDGIPLGIELAAARTRLLSPAQIRVQLEQTSALVSSRSAARVERHRSLDSVIAWSYDLLDDAEQQAFRVLSLFVGGCDVDDFSHVAQIEDLEAAREVLERLVSNSLAIRVSLDGERDRWRMLETIASFGRARVAEDPHGARVRARFARRMLKHTTASNTFLARSLGVEQRFIRERANVHASFDWALEHAPDIAADIFIGMDRYLHTRGSMHEGDELGRRLQGRIDVLEPVRQSLVLGLAGRMAHYRGDDIRSSIQLEQGLRLAALHGHEPIELKVLIWYVERLRMVGETQTAMELAETARQLALKLDDPWHLGLAQSQRGFALNDLEHPGRGREEFQQAETLFREVGDAFWIENVVANLLIGTLFDTLDESLIDELARCEARIASLECWTYAAHVEAYRLRALLEVGRFDAAAACAAALIPRVRNTGEAMLLMFTLACASVAFIENDQPSIAIASAVESLELAVASTATMFAEYSLGALACTLHPTDERLSRWVASHIEMEHLDGIYTLDRHVMDRVTASVGTIAPSSHDHEAPRSRVDELQGVLDRLSERTAAER